MLDVAATNAGVDQWSRDGICAQPSQPNQSPRSRRFSKLNDAMLAFTAPCRMREDEERKSHPVEENFYEVRLQAVTGQCDADCCGAEEISMDQGSSREKPEAGSAQQRAHEDRCLVVGNVLNYAGLDEVQQPKQALEAFEALLQKNALESTQALEPEQEPAAPTAPPSQQTLHLDQAVFADRLSTTQGGDTCSNTITSDAGLEQDVGDAEAGSAQRTGGGVRCDADSDAETSEVDTETAFLLPGCLRPTPAAPTRSDLDFERLSEGGDASVQRICRLAGALEAALKECPATAATALCVPYVLQQIRTFLEVVRARRNMEECAQEMWQTLACLLSEMLVMTSACVQSSGGATHDWEDPWEDCQDVAENDMGEWISDHINQKLAKITDDGNDDTRFSLCSTAPPLSSPRAPSSSASLPPSSRSSLPSSSFKPWAAFSDTDHTATDVKFSGCKRLDPVASAAEPVEFAEVLTPDQTCARIAISKAFQSVPA